jgi:hypothetical protein
MGIPRTPGTAALYSNVAVACGEQFAADCVHRQRGVPLPEETSVPAKAEYTPRIAIHDHKADHAGAVESRLPVSAGFQLRLCNLRAITIPIVILAKVHDDFLYCI